MGVFPLFALKFPHEATCWHENIFAKGHLFSNATPTVNHRSYIQAGVSGNLWLVALVVLVETTGLCQPLGGRLCTPLPSVQKSVLDCFASNPPPKLINELNSSLPVDVESDRNIFYRQNVEIRLVCCLFCFLDSLWLNFADEGKVVPKKKGTIRDYSDCSDKEVLFTWLVCCFGFSVCLW